MAENKKKSVESLLSDFRMLLGDGEQSSLPNHRKAYAALQKFCASGRGEPGNFDSSLLRDWVSWLFYEKYSRATVEQYLKKISALYNKSVGAQGKDHNPEILEVRKLVAALDESHFPLSVCGPVLPRLQEILKRSLGAAGKARLAYDLVLFAVYIGGLTFDELSGYGRDEYAGDNAEILAIVRRNRSETREQLFDLGQGKSGSQEVNKRIGEMFRQVLRQSDIKLSPEVCETALDLWLTAAYECVGAFGKALGGAGRRSRSNPVFALSEIAPMAGAERSELRELVVRTIVNDPVEWHAMQLRSQVKTEELMERLADERNEGKIVKVYCPMEEISRRVGHRIVYKCKPVLPGFVLFLSKASVLTSLFRDIGDIAWCYRMSREPGSPYAVIPESQLRAMQLAIGTFTPDTMLYPIGTIPLDKDDKVEIIGGAMLGKVAEVSAVERKARRTVYRLNLINGNGVEWEVDSASLLVRKLTDEQFEKAVRNIDKI